MLIRFGLGAFWVSEDGPRSAKTDLDRAASRRGLPTYAMEFGGLAMPNGFAIPFAAFSFAHLPLPPHGTVGLDPTALVPLAFAPVVAGTGVLTVLIPNQPALAGLRFGFQAILGDGQSLLLSPVVYDVVGF